MKNGITIGNTHIGSLSLAPMAGVADKAFRTICKKHGCDYFTTEMISSKGVYYGDKKTIELASISKEEEPISVQIFGSEPDVMAKAAYTLSEYITKNGCSPLSFDINMGCPVPKIVKNGDGSALMKTPNLAGEIVKAVKNAIPGIPVTVKTRLGWDLNSINILEFSKIIEDSGADLITIHARTRSQLYGPSVNWDYIRQVKEQLSIPVVGNGDVITCDDAFRMYEETGCDGIAIGRGAIGNPWLFEEIKAKSNNLTFIPPSKKERIDTAIEYLDLMIETKGEKTGIVESRKVIPHFTKGLYGSPKIRNDINMTTDAQKIREMLYSLLI